MSTAPQESHATASKSVTLNDLQAALREQGTDPATFANLAAGLTLSLYARVNRRCWLVGATHEHEVYVEDQTGQRFAVDRLVLHQDIGGHRQDREGSNTSQVGRTETEVNMGCRSSGCSGTATYRGVSWSCDWVRV